MAKVTYSPEESVTVLIARYPRADRIAEFDRILGETISAALEFPGHLGVSVLRPTGADTTYRILSRFASAAALDAWRTSPQAKELFAKLNAEEEKDRTELDMGGSNAWFADPIAGALAKPNPLRVLSALWIAAWITITTLLFVLRPYVAELALPLQTAILCTVMVPLLTYVVMPVVHRAFRALSSWPRDRPLKQQTIEAAERGSMPSCQTIKHHPSAPMNCRP